MKSRNGYLAYDRAGIAHATWGYGAKKAYCGLKLYNFHKRVKLDRDEWGDGYVYEPPPDAKVTCLACAAEEEP